MGGTVTSQESCKVGPQNDSPTDLPLSALSARECFPNPAPLQTRPLESPGQGSTAKCFPVSQVILVTHLGTVPWSHCSFGEDGFYVVSRRQKPLGLHMD